MQEYQMFEEILPDIYRIELPLPDSPLRALNSYLIKSEDRNLVIDTGLNHEECHRVISSALALLKVDLHRTDFYITHMHADHFGLLESLITDRSVLYFNRNEAPLVNARLIQRQKRFDGLDEVFLAQGFPEDELEKAIKSHPGRRPCLQIPRNFRILQEGDTVSIGDYTFRYLDTPGHSPGHGCLYEADNKILIAGDHILADITPNITLWPEMEDSLALYLVSLEKVYPLDVDIVLPGHRRVIYDHRKRIREIEEHHRERLKEVKAALENGGKTAFQIAPYLTWDIEYDSWAGFPAQQKWFAVGETIAHIKYLQVKMELRADMKEGRILYTLA